VAKEEGSGGGCQHTREETRKGTARKRRQKKNKKQVLHVGPPGIHKTKGVSLVQMSLVKEEEGRSGRKGKGKERKGQHFCTKKPQGQGTSP